jgi:hypothetical protein
VSGTPTLERPPSPTVSSDAAAIRRLKIWLWIVAAVALVAGAVAVGYATGTIGTGTPAETPAADGPAADDPAADDPAADDPADDAAVQPPAVRYDEEPRANWDVAGVAADDVLNVRDAPGVDGTIVATLAHDAAEFESTGRIAYVGQQLWREVIVPGDGVGWVSGAYLTETR